MSKSMCGCGCSIISSLMKRLGRTACCSDLFTSHTSEQLQRLATGCPPQPKVTMRQRPVTQPHLCLHFPPDQPAVYSLWLITRVQCRKHMGPDGRKPRVWNTASLFICFACPKRFLRYESCTTRESGAVIDSLIEPGDLMAVSLPWQQWTCFQLAESFKWMPSDGLGFTLIAAPHQLEEKLLLMEQIKAKQDCVCVCVCVCVWVLVCTCQCVWMGVWLCSHTGFCLMAAASRVPSVSWCVMHMTVSVVGRHWLRF